MYNIETLARLAGITRRAVRYYIQRGLLAPPEGQKRGSYYTEQHLNRLKDIIRYSSQGVPLIKMKDALEGNPEKTICPEKQNRKIKRDKFERIKFAGGIELQFKSDVLNEDELEKIKSVVEEIMKGKSNDK